VLDATDLEGTLPWPYLEKLNQGLHHPVFVVNKIDCVPSTVSREKLKGWVGKRLKSLLPDLQLVGSAEQDSSDICLVSSKAHLGIKALVSRLKALNVGEEKKYVHAVGVTNTGKSSLMNSLREETKKCRLA
jgi:ribosome biogenesis GTPase A